VNKPLVNVDPDILGGTPVFYGTRVPIQNLTDYLVGGDSIEQFLDDFPTVTKEQVIQFLDLVAELVIAAHMAKHENPA
jgi:uncharacterized protein (DUF433 family)